jgi:hypothetical protein
MTVINMLNLGREGIAVADEQSSAGSRKFNVAEKLHLIGGNVIYGGTGSADLIRDVYEAAGGTVKSYLKEHSQVHVRDIYNIVNERMIDATNDIKNNVLRTCLGITYGDLLTGMHSETGRPLDDAAKQNAGNVLRERSDYMNMGASIGGIQDGHFEIYEVDTNGLGQKCSRPYSSIGSGADESQKVLSTFVALLPRVAREKIGLAQGLAKTIEATNASSALNVGVGGIPSIVYISKNGILRPDEESCILSTELVKGMTGEFLPEKFVHEKLEGLVKGEEKARIVEREMMKNATSRAKFLRFLRGYKD